MISKLCHHLVVVTGPTQPTNQPCFLCIKSDQRYRSEQSMLCYSVLFWCVFHLFFSQLPKKQPFNPRVPPTYSHSGVTPALHSRRITPPLPCPTLPHRLFSVSLSHSYPLRQRASKIKLWGCLKALFCSLLRYGVALFHKFKMVISFCFSTLVGGRWNLQPQEKKLVSIIGISLR